MKRFISLVSDAHTQVNDNGIFNTIQNMCAYEHNRERALINRSYTRDTYICCLVVIHFNKVTLKFNFENLHTIKRMNMQITLHSKSETAFSKAFRLKASSGTPQS